MTAYKGKEWNSVAKKKRMTSRERKSNAKMKRKLQERGALPPDKPRLNRKKFIEETRSEWNNRDSQCLIWDLYLMDAMSYMLGHLERGGRLSLEAVGAAKVLKLAMRLREFSEELKEKGENEYKLADQYNYIKDIMHA